MDNSGHKYFITHSKSIHDIHGTKEIRQTHFFPILIVFFLLFTLASCGTHRSINQSQHQQSRSSNQQSGFNYSQDAFNDDALRAIAILNGQLDQHIPDMQQSYSQQLIDQGYDPRSLRYKNLLDRLRTGYGMDLNNNHPRVRKQRQWLIDNKHYLNKVLERSKLYLFYVVGELEKRNLPTELALLPIVESAYNPTVTSHSGAAGLWQFIPSTGRSFGMEQNWWKDERRDIVASTESALTYLNNLNKRFDDWALALAAYNAGQGTIGRALKKNARRGRAQSYWSLKLSQETTNYVPKLFALAQVIKKPQQYGITLPKIENRMTFAAYKVSGPIDLYSLRKQLNINETLFTLFNPGYKKSFAFGDGPHRIIVPINKSAQFTAWLNTQHHSQVIDTIEYQVKKDDNLRQIALAYDTDINAIKTRNELTSDLIYIGQRLAIPTSLVNTSVVKPLKTKQIAAQTPHQEKTTPIIVTKASQSQAEIADIIDGEKIPAHSSQDPRANLDIINQIVRAYEQKKQPIQTASHDEAYNKHVAANTLAFNDSTRTKPKTYQVQIGDSLYQISKRFQVALPKLIELNNLSSTTATIHPGQILELY